MKINLLHWWRLKLLIRWLIISLLSRRRLKLSIVRGLIRLKLKRWKLRLTLLRWYVLSLGLMNLGSLILHLIGGKACGWTCSFDWDCDWTCSNKCCCWIGWNVRICDWNCWDVSSERWYLFANEFWNSTCWFDQILKIDENSDEIYCDDEN